jgi:hypothetical protein
MKSVAVIEELPDVLISLKDNINQHMNELDGDRQIKAGVLLVQVEYL